jgi:hypothetical protein
MGGGGGGLKAGIRHGCTRKMTQPSMCDSVMTVACTHLELLKQQQQQQQQQKQQQQKQQQQ